jgi:hypothetical protein
MHSTRRLLSHYIETLHRPLLSDVSARLAQSQPVIIRGALSHWPALTDWTLANGLGRLRARAEGVMVPVEWGRKGRGFLDGGEKGKGEMPLGESRIASGQTTFGHALLIIGPTKLSDVFLDAFLLERIPKADPSSPLSEIIFYSAQHDLLSAVSRRPGACVPSATNISTSIDGQVPELKEDLPPFKEPYLAAGKGEFWRSNVWIGPMGTFSPWVLRGSAGLLARPKCPNNLLSHPLEEYIRTLSTSTISLKKRSAQLIGTKLVTTSSAS